MVISFTHLLPLSLDWRYHSLVYTAAELSDQMCWYRSIIIIAEEEEEEHSLKP